MATIEELSMAQRALQNLVGLRLDMRDNARQYIADNSNGRVSDTKIVEIATGDIFNYRKRIKWMSDIIANQARRLKLKSGFEALGLTSINDVAVDFQQLIAATDALELIDISNIVEKSNDLLNNLQAFDGIWE